MVSTTGEHSAWFELDKDLKPQPAAMPAPVQKVVERIAENCEPALCTVLFMAGAGGSLRAGVTENPVRLTRSVRDTLTRVTLGGVPAYRLAGRRHHPDGRCREDAGEVASATCRRRRWWRRSSSPCAPSDYAALGGYASRAVTLEDVVRAHKVRLE